VLLGAITRRATAECGQLDSGRPPGTLRFDHHASSSWSGATWPDGTEPSCDLSGIHWRTSSFSNSDGGNNCVEVAFLPDGEVAVCDTKARSGASHVHTATAWVAFLAAVRAGEFGPR
jgi:hypothetical protein